MHAFMLSPTLLCIAHDEGRKFRNLIQGHTKAFSFPVPTLHRTGESIIYELPPLLSTAHDEDNKFRNLIPRVTVKPFPFQSQLFIGLVTVSLCIISLSTVVLRIVGIGMVPIIIDVWGYDRVFCSSCSSSSDSTPVDNHHPKRLVILISP